MQQLTDGKWRLLDFDPATLIAEWFWYDEEKDKIVIRKVQEVENILDRNREMEVESHNQRFGDMQMVASVPITVATEQLFDAVKNKDQDFVKKFLNDSDNRKFRTFRGHL